MTPAGGGADLTIEELARRTGMTVRNVRSWQSKGLLPEPEIRGRTGYYGPAHLTRITAVRELLDDGFGLTVIARMLASAGGQDAQVLHFTRSVLAGHDGGEPVLLDRAELLEPWGERAYDGLVEDWTALGLLRAAGADRFEVVSPRLVAISVQLAGVGLDPRVLVEVTRSVLGVADDIAGVYVHLFLESVLGPVLEQQETPDWESLEETMVRLRRLAGEATAAMVALRLDARAEQAVHELSLPGVGEDLAMRRPT